MEVVMPVHAAPSTADFNFDSNCSSPFVTAPSSPQRSGISSFYRHLNDHSSSTTTSNTKANFNEEEYEDEDFEFNFSGQLDQRTSLSADELFDGGKIRPLKPPAPPPTRHDYESGPNPFQVVQVPVQERGRERVYSDSCSRKGTRSLSPIRVSDIIEDNSQRARITITSKKSYATSILSAISFSKKKWKLKDLLLFRSASEGRATSPDSLRKYAVLSKKHSIDIDDEDVKNSSFRSTDNSGSVSRRPPRAAMSAHELHYTANRAVSEELKRKTFLPYKQGLLGCLGFNPSGVQDISRGIGSLPRV